MIDFIKKLLLVAKKNTILVVCNRLSKITHFVTTTKRTLVEELVWSFRDNIQKLYRLLESIMLDSELQFTAEMMKKLNKMVRIETKLLTSVTNFIQLVSSQQVD